MNILFLAHRIPYPPNKGDKIRSFNEIKHLSKEHSIFLVTTLDEPEEEEYVSELSQYCEDVYAVYFNRRARLLAQLMKPLPFSVLSFYDNDIQVYVDKLILNNRFDAIIVFCSSMAQYVLDSEAYKKGRLSDVRLILDFVDMDSYKWAQYGKYSRFPLSMIYQIENRRLFKYEVKLNALFGSSVFSSVREVKAFLKHHPDAQNVEAVPNGVDFQYFCLEKDHSNKGEILPKHGPILLFTGVMDYFANEDGVVWFCNSIFPTIRAAIPDVEFYIVGNKPTDLVWALTELDGVTVTGFVPDIRPYYWMADVCVVPLRIARGLQNKILEAMATGNAVVATSNASDGILCSDNHDIVIAETEEAFSSQAVYLLNDASKRHSLAENARKNILHNYSWEKNMMELDRLLLN